MPCSRTASFSIPTIWCRFKLLRQVQVDQRSVSESASVRGLSRASFYQAQTAFEQDGLFGLLPLKRGPRGGRTQQQGDGVRLSTAKACRLLRYAAN